MMLLKSEEGRGKQGQVWEGMMTKHEAQRGERRYEMGREEGNQGFSSKGTGRASQGKTVVA